jgi:glyoxylase-like metal-dependent hydrolase (beta-lactamase superfamily II)
MLYSTESLDIGSDDQRSRCPLFFSNFRSVSVISFRSISTNVLTALALSGAVALSMGTAANAAAPMVKTSAPGFYRVMLGDFEVTVISDGTVALPMDKYLTNIKPADLTEALKKHHLKNPIETSVNAYLINTGNKLVLIDTGAGNLFGPTLGKLAANIKAAGYQPEQVDEIYITHMHSDHFGGLTAAEAPVFPNALVRADQHDVDFWLSAASLQLAPADKKATYETVQAVFAPYIKADKFKAFDGDTELTPGIKALATHGHTPGHSIYQIESKGEKLMLWGDLMHVAAVQFEQPSVTIAFDSDSKAAAIQRQKAYADAAKFGYMVGAAHLSFPGLGYVRPEGKAYAWVPLNYTPVQ